VPDIGGGLLVQAQPHRQGRDRGPPGQGGRDEEERDGAQQQRGGQQHGLVHEIRPGQPLPQGFGPGPGILLLAPLGRPADALPRAMPLIGLNIGLPGLRRLARLVGGLMRCGGEP
jgi:hypothetical protein